jgi:hypothetical protein
VQHGGAGADVLVVAVQVVLQRRGALLQVSGDSLGFGEELFVGA